MPLKPYRRPRRHGEPDEVVVRRHVRRRPGRGRNRCPRPAPHRAPPARPRAADCANRRRCEASIPLPAPLPCEDASSLGQQARSRASRRENCDLVLGAAAGTIGAERPPREPSCQIRSGTSASCSARSRAHRLRRRKSRCRSRPRKSSKAAPSTTRRARCATARTSTTARSRAPLKGDAFMRKYGGKPARALFDVHAHDDADGQPRLAVRGHLRGADGADPRSRTTSSPATTPLPADPQLLAAMQVPAGGFSFMAFSPYTARAAVDRPTPLASFNAVTDDAIAAPPAGDWLGWRRSYDAQGFSPLREIDTRNVAEPAARVELDDARGLAPKACRSCATARSSCKPTATSCRRSTRRPAICSGSTRTRSSTARRRSTSAASRCTATGSISARRTCTSSRSTSRRAQSSGTRRSATSAAAKA